MSHPTTFVNYRKLFWRVTIRQELFTHGVAIPIILYMALVATGLYKDINMVISASFWAAANASYLLVGIFIWRWFYLARLFGKLNQASASDDKAELCRLRNVLLRYPILEMWIIAFRFIIGITTFMVSMYLVHGWLESLNTMYLFALAIDVPICMVVYLFFTQSAVRDVVRKIKVHEIDFPRQDLMKVGYFWRALLGFASVAIMPFSFFVYLFLAIDRGYVDKSGLMMHVTVISVLVIISVTIISIIATRSIKRAVEESGRSMEMLGKGEFNIDNEPYTADEFGLLAYDVSRVGGQLRVMYDNLKDLNLNLERKVEERTRELEKTLESIKKLKEQQDGDYFLTSLLQTPLNGVHATSDNIEASIMVKQKTALEFRKRAVTIGGDLCSVHKIVLRGKEYTAFVNADAMGKSIQGAGGAIVLGSAFQSIISRSVATAVKDQYPEKWLYNCYLDLQAIFVTFDGSMLISAVLGLIDDQTGALYYINAEHPSVVLYRQGQARFLEDDNRLLKIGVAEMEKHVRVFTHQLQPDDVVILGSDGRDDLITEFLEDGRRVINEDENLFLQHVQTSGSELQAMLESIESTGKQMDDLSLMRLVYRVDQAALINQTDQNIADLYEDGRIARKIGELEKAKSIFTRVLVEKPDHKDAHRQLALIYLRNKQYGPAMQHCLRVIDLDPVDTDFLHYSAYTLKKKGRFQEAVAIAERMRLREPDHLEGAMNLADLYVLNERLEQAQLALEHARDLGVEPHRLQRIEQRLDHLINIA